MIVNGITAPYGGRMYYSVNVPGDISGTLPIEGGRYGDQVKFTINGVMNAATGVWRSGTNQEVDLR